MKETENDCDASQPGWLLELTEGKCLAEECEGITVFGISASGGGFSQVRIEDISSRREVVEELLALCHGNKVPPDILFDIVEDALL